MYETPELGKLNGGGDAAPTSGLYRTIGLQSISIYLEW